LFPTPKKFKHEGQQRARWANRDAAASRESLRAQIISGGDVATGELLQITEALRELTPPAPTTLTIEIVDHTDLCLKCVAPLPPVAERVPVEPPAGSNAKASALPPPARAANVVPSTRP
jgi:hypothetical protein